MIAWLMIACMIGFMTWMTASLIFCVAGIGRKRRDRERKERFVSVRELREWVEDSSVLYDENLRRDIV